MKKIKTDNISQIDYFEPKIGLKILRFIIMFIFALFIIGIFFYSSVMLAMKFTYDHFAGEYVGDVSFNEAMHVLSEIKKEPASSITAKNYEKKEENAALAKRLEENPILGIDKINVDELVQKVVTITNKSLSDEEKKNLEKKLRNDFIKKIKLNLSKEDLQKAINSNGSVILNIKDAEIASFVQTALEGISTEDIFNDNSFLNTLDIEKLSDIIEIRNVKIEGNGKETELRSIVGINAHKFINNIDRIVPFDKIPFTKILKPAMPLATQILKSITGKIIYVQATVFPYDENKEAKIKLNNLIKDGKSNENFYKLISNISSAINKNEQNNTNYLLELNKNVVNFAKGTSMPLIFNIKNGEVQIKIIQSIIKSLNIFIDKNDWTFEMKEKELLKTLYNISTEQEESAIEKEFSVSDYTDLREDLKEQYAIILSEDVDTSLFDRGIQNANFQLNREFFTKEKDLKNYKINMKGLANILESIMQKEASINDIFGNDSLKILELDYKSDDELTLKIKISIDVEKLIDKKFENSEDPSLDLMKGILKKAVKQLFPNAMPMEFETVLINKNNENEVYKDERVNTTILSQISSYNDSYTLLSNIKSLLKIVKNQNDENENDFVFSSEKLTDMIDKYIKEALLKINTALPGNIKMLNIEEDGLYLSNFYALLLANIDKEDTPENRASIYSVLKRMNSTNKNVYTLEEKYSYKTEEGADVYFIEDDTENISDERIDEKKLAGKIVNILRRSTIGYIQNAEVAYLNLIPTKSGALEYAKEVKDDILNKYEGNEIISQLLQEGNNKIGVLVSRIIIKPNFTGDSDFLNQILPEEISIRIFINMDDMETFHLAVVDANGNENSLLTAMLNKTNPNTYNEIQEAITIALQDMRESDMYTISLAGVEYSVSYSKLLQIKKGGDVAALFTGNPLLAGKKFTDDAIKVEKNNSGDNKLLSDLVFAEFGIE